MNKMGEEVPMLESHVPQSRREFLRKAGKVGFTAGWLLAAGSPMLAVTWISQAGAVIAKRSYVPGRFALELDGLHCGFLSAFEGGNITADVVSELMGPDLIQRKHLAGLRVEPITIECGLDMAKPLYDWISAMLDGKALRKNGAIIT